MQAINGTATEPRQKGSSMAKRSDGVRTEKRILSVCVRLFLEHGYHGTTMQQIYREAGVSASSFQNLFGSKDGVLMELMRFMYENQFGAARGVADPIGDKQLPPVYVYAVETALQLAIAELNENVRECYIEAYSYHETLEYIQRETARKLHQIFGPYQPGLAESDFYVLDIGTAGMMRGYMANPCTDEFALEDKIAAFLGLALRGFRVPEDEVRQVLAFVSALDVRSIASEVMGQLFRALALRYDFSLDGVLLGQG